MEATEFKKLFETVRPKKVGNDSLMATAFHETGHVLIDMVYGFSPKTVTIAPNEQKSTLGTTQNFWDKEEDNLEDWLEFNGIKTWSVQKQIEYLVISLLGGIIGGAFYSSEYNWYGAESDLNKILDQFLHYGIFEIPNLRPYWDKTFNLIESNKMALFKIANDLYSAKTLDAKYFRNIRLKLILIKNI